SGPGQGNRIAPGTHRAAGPVVRPRIRRGHHGRRDGERPARAVAAGAGQPAPAVRPGGVMYLTVEEARQAKIDQAYESLSARGLPVVRGETVEGDVAGYHYYPGRDQVVQWLAGEGLTIIDEGFKWVDGWGCRHFLLR